MFRICIPLRTKCLAYVFLWIPIARTSTSIRTKVFNYHVFWRSPSCKQFRKDKTVETQKLEKKDLCDLYELGLVPTCQSDRFSQAPSLMTGFIPPGGRTASNLRKWCLILAVINWLQDLAVPQLMLWLRRGRLRIIGVNNVYSCPGAVSNI